MPMPKQRTTNPYRAHDLIPYEVELFADIGPAIEPQALPSSTPAIQGEPVAYKGERVLTTEMAAREFGVNARLMSNNHDRNRERFEEGKHFYLIVGDELRELKNSTSLRGSVGANARSLILWTDRGIARHAKILDSDEAWTVYERLEDNYFSVKEAVVAQAPAFQVPTTLREALLLAAAQEEEIERHRALADAATAQAIELKRTKAKIGSKREASAMATASAEKRKANKLEIELDRAVGYATVKRMEIAHGRKFPFAPLRAASRAMDLEIRVVPDPNFGSVKSYHARAWQAAYSVDVPGWTGDGDAE